MDIQNISQHYLKKLIISDSYLSNTPCREKALLYPDFYILVQQGISQFNQIRANVEVVLIETYRSNTLQECYYNSGASKIRKNGMHHYGIAADCAFKVDGNLTFNGDYKNLRSCFLNVGLYILGLWDAGHVQFIPATTGDQNVLRKAVNKAVINFQNENGLDADGIVGKLTIQKAKQIYG